MLATLCSRFGKHWRSAAAGLQEDGDGAGLPKAAREGLMRVRAALAAAGREGKASGPRRHAAGKRAADCARWRLRERPAALATVEATPTAASTLGGTP